MEAIAQCTADVNSSNKIVDHTDYLQAFLLLLQNVYDFSTPDFSLQTNDTHWEKNS